jgi:hypothetical protein
VVKPEKMLRAYGTRKGKWRGRKAERKPVGENESEK